MLGSIGLHAHTENRLADLYYPTFAILKIALQAFTTQHLPY